MAKSAYDKIRDAAWEDIGECRFGGDVHAPGHPSDLKFSVLIHGETEWFEGTEDEIIERIGVDENGFLAKGFSHGSHFDFWYAP